MREDKILTNIVEKLVPNSPLEEESTQLTNLERFEKYFAEEHSYSRPSENTKDNSNITNKVAKSTVTYLCGYLLHARSS